MSDDQAIPVEAFDLGVLAELMTAAAGVLPPDMAPAMKGMVLVAAGVACSINRGQPGEVPFGALDALQSMRISSRMLRQALEELQRLKWAPPIGGPQ